MAPYLATLILAVSTGYIYPLPSWHVTTQHGEDLGNGLYHMGVDAGFDLPAGTEVYATADGIVREVQERSQFGLVVLIEHEAETEAAHVSVYGHLDPTDVRVIVGQTVTAGDVIGVLGNETNNGGWSVHLHFGIHKAAYTGDWVYYGHVYDPDTAKQWYNPEKFIPKHFGTDIWQPTLTTALVDGDIVGNSIPLTATVGDRGNGVQTLTVKIKTTATAWITVGSYDQPYYDWSDTIDISSYPDGEITFKLIARDGVTEKTTLTRTVIKDPYRYTTPAFFAAKAGSSDNFITQWSFGGTTLQAFYPFSETWSAGGYIAVANETIVAVRRDTKQSTSVAKFFTEAGELINTFKLKNTQPNAIAYTGDSLVVADERSHTVSGYTNDGTVQWTVTPNLVVTDVVLSDTTLYLCGTQNGKTKVLLMDTTGTVLTQFRPFSKYTTTTGCHLALGDVTGDGSSDIVLGSFGTMVGTVAVFSLDGQRELPSFQPFGEDFTGQVDVVTLPWDTTEDSVIEDEVLVSQASSGQAWVKTYQLSGTPVVLSVLFEKRVYEESFTNGTHVVSSRYDE